MHPICYVTRVKGSSGPLRAGTIHRLRATDLMDMTEIPDHGRPETATEGPHRDIAGKFGKSRM